MTKNREFPFCPETIIYYGRNIKVLLVATLLLTAAPTKAGNILKTVISQISFAKKDFADTIKIKVFDGAVICHMTHRRLSDRSQRNTHQRYLHLYADRKQEKWHSAEVP